MWAALQRIIQKSRSHFGILGGRRVTTSNFHNEHPETLVTTTHNWGRDCSVGIATLNGLDGPGIESRWGRDLSHPSRPVMVPTECPIEWIRGLFRGDKAARAWR